jgi:Rieske Fe-S protein
MGILQPPIRDLDSPGPSAGPDAERPEMAVTGPRRRTVLRGAVATGLGLPFLAACGSDSSEASGDSTSTPASGKQSSAAADPSGSSALATTNEVPEGGGLVLADDGVVITQPKAGTFEGFSSACTHAGCPVDNVSDGTINCICHGSQFSIEDGSVVTGPASAPLARKPVVVKGNDIALG